MDGSGNVTGRIPFGYLTGVVSGADVTGTVNASVGSRGGRRFVTYAATGAVSNTIGGYELDVQYTGAGNAVVSFTALGCRVN
jgi:hypothetical protein